MTRSIDIVLHDEEVTGEAHRLHHVQLEVDTFPHMLRQRVAVKLGRPDIGQFSQIIGFQLQTVKLVTTAQFLHFLFGVLAAEHHVAVFVAGKLLKQVLVGIFLPIAFFGSKFFRNGKVRHNRCMVDAVKLHLVANVASVGQCLRHVCKHFIHFRPRLEPFLFGIKHTFRVVQITVGAQADQTVVCFGILLFHKMAVVRTDQLHVIFTGQFY